MRKTVFSISSGINLRMIQNLQSVKQNSTFSVIGADVTAGLFLTFLFTVFPPSGNVPTVQTLAVSDVTLCVSIVA